MKGYIYSLHAKTEKDVFYIGATINPKERKSAHRTAYPYYVFDCDITLSIIEEIEIKDRSELRPHEIYWIHQFIAWGFPLENYLLYCGTDIRLLKRHIEIENEFRKEREAWNFNRQKISSL